MTVHSPFILDLFLVRIIDRDAHIRRNVVTGKQALQSLARQWLHPAWKMTQHRLLVLRTTSW